MLLFPKPSESPSQRTLTTTGSRPTFFVSLARSQLPAMIQLSHSWAVINIRNVTPPVFFSSSVAIRKPPAAS
ncbi:MAG: hypothetical protein ACR2PX_11550 [Endozoicomonas sp.]|uniref:hypothetical protein n=1 Tax=Endozoicomonas sp. TaxID=1892382 RepID=UPI003D9B681E